MAKDKGWPANESTSHEFSSTENVSSTEAGMVLLTAITLMSRIITWIKMRITVCKWMNTWIYLRSHISFYKKKANSKPVYSGKKTPKQISSKYLRVRHALYNPLSLKIKVMYGKAKKWETFKTALADQVHHETTVINPPRMENTTSGNWQH